MYNDPWSWVIHYSNRYNNLQIFIHNYLISIAKNKFFLTSIIGTRMYMLLILSTKPIIIIVKSLKSWYKSFNPWLLYVRHINDQYFKWSSTHYPFLVSSSTQTKAFRRSRSNVAITIYIYIYWYRKRVEESGCMFTHV